MYKYDWLDIMPNINLVTNIGYDSEATNNVVTSDSKTAQKFGNLPRYEINEINHPTLVEITLDNELKQLKHRIFQDKNVITIYFLVYFNLLNKIYNRLRKLYHFITK